MNVYHKPEAKLVRELQDIANKLRIEAVTATQAAGSGHPTSCSSVAEIISVLFYHTMRYKISEPKDPSSDRFVLSKGHAAPILYAAWAEAGLFPVSDLLNLRKLECDLEGHPTPRLNFIDVATGSLGQGLSNAAGMAFVGKYYDRADYRVYCVIGDGESAEGSIWECLHFSGHYKLDNLCLIVDVNRLGQSEPTSLEYDLNVYRKRLASFGWNVVPVNGHDVQELMKAFHVASVTKDKPTAIVAKTIKGKNFPGIENLEGWHGKPLGDRTDHVIKHLRGLLNHDGPIELRPQEPQEDVSAVDVTSIRLTCPPAYKVGDLVATRAAYGTALAKIARNCSRVIALDSDTKNSTCSEKIKEVDPSQFVECFIAEQNLVGVAIGAACRDRTVVFVSTFAAFLTRAFDQIRMGAISQSNVNFVGSHCGVSIGEDGPSQMGLEDIAMFRSVPNCTIFYPSDAVSCERAVELAANTKGVCFIRTSRPKMPVIYSDDQLFRIGKAHILLQSETDRVLLIAAGVTLHEALAASAELHRQGIAIRVMDLFTIKPIDRDAIIQNAKEVGGRIVTVEDHYAEGGLGEAVLSTVAEEKDVIVRKMAVTMIPHSGKPSALLQQYGISADHIIHNVKEILKL